MKIAQVCPLTEAVPPKTYGGTERIVAYLADELVSQGHDVTLFTSGDSVSRAKIEAIWPRALRFDETVRDYLAPHMMLVETIARRAEEFDIIHLHVDYIAYSALKRTGVPFLATLHGRLDLPELQPLYTLFSDVPVVSISNAQRRPLPHANYVTTIYHGIPERLLQPGFGAGGYLAFLGRISPEKAPDAAIRIAARAGMRLKIAAKIDKVDRNYFTEHVKPLFDLPHVEYIGEIDEQAKSEFLGNAAGLLFPIAWSEPFGLSMIEAMACGTPVVAIRKGSVPEVLDHGVTGLIVDDEDEAVEAVAALPSLDRSRIRRVFEKRFTARRMAEDYVAVYRRSIACGRQLKATG
ncbi:MAG TPA: glycosyltransferase family 4 protein [Stellaceae bacterium]|nr:glycosyltransferase family 4 protein [Stellaceae bacterium]